MVINGKTRRKWGRICSIVTAQQWNGDYQGKHEETVEKICSSAISSTTNREIKLCFLLEKPASNA
jgi:hypothetical protein